MSGKTCIVAAMALLCLLFARGSFAQTAVKEDFTGAGTTNLWYSFNGACLTAGGTTTGPAFGTPGNIPGCNAIQSYYNENLVGGYNGVAGSSQTLPDPAPDANGSYGALRFTNGCIPSGTSCSSGGHNQNGLIISGDTFPAGQGVEITFKTVTYRGDSGSNGAGCPSGSSASNGQCVTTTTVAASCPSGYTLSGSTCKKSGQPNKTPSCPGGYTLSGSSCTETNVVLATDPHQTDGADGISFFLMDGSDPVTLATTVGNYGSWGGSLGYSCSNSNGPYNGLVGAYIGLGIDEFGNFLNGTNNTLGVTNPQSMGDNTASGGGQWANRIGMRGAGNVSWYWLNNEYPAYYPSTLTTAQQQAAVKATCQTGTIWNYSSPSAPVNTGLTQSSNNSGSILYGSNTTLYDYQAIPAAFEVLPAGPSGVQIANEYATGGYARGNAVPITYKLQLTQNGLLSLWYSVNGGSWLGVLNGQSIKSSNPGAMPNSFRFGFAGSTGGSSNIHEVMCFQAAPDQQASSSASANDKQSAQLQTGSQAYFAYYDPDDWTGRLTANNLSYNAGSLQIAPTANWDASCVLTGGACTTTGVAVPTAQGPEQRTILSWNGTSGVPFRYEDLNTTQQSELTASAAPLWSLVSYLRGNRSDEINSSGAGLYRARDSVLSDIVDSSPVWVGPVEGSYPATWRDNLFPTATLPENAGPSYTQYITAQQTRQNVVYVGADDGLMHGFRSGAYGSDGSWLAATNDGQEVLAYMPSAVVDDIHNTANSQLDFSNPQYGHNFYADATPGTGDLYYGGAWHTWLVSGLGAGGADIFALDITHPGNFSEGNASTLVIGDWTSSTISCANVAGCGSSLGNTYGSPIIRRLHNGDWAMIFGNGVGSSSGDAGIYIMTVAANTGATTFYYLSTDKTGTSDGIAYVTSADLDGDNVTDYVYAGDLSGNVWRFDLTSDDPVNWKASTAPLFTTGAGQPITTKLMVVGVHNGSLSAPQLMVAFGTGQKIPLTNTSGTTYAPGTQAIYAFWDWNLSGWNAKSSVQYAALAPSASGLSSPYTLTPGNLQAQTMTLESGSSADRDISSTAICWQGTTVCGSSDNMFGWSTTLPGSGEQIIYNPEILSTAFLVNSIVPYNNSPLACSTQPDSGYTYAISMQTGGAINGFFVNPNSNGDAGSGSGDGSGDGSTSGTTTAGVLTDATGTSFVIGGPGGTPPPSPGPPQDCSQKFLVYQTVGGTPSSTAVAPPCNALGKRLTWAQLR